MALASSRALLGTTGIIVAGPAVSSKVPDHDTVRLGHLLEESWRLENAAWEAAKGENDDEGPNTIMADEQTEVSSAIVGKIEATSVATLAGVLVKVRAIFWCRNDDPFTPGCLGSDGSPATETRLLVGLMRDLQRMSVATRT